MLSEKTIESVLKEGSRFPPPKDFTAAAHWRDDAIYAEAERDPETFWAKMAGMLHWSRRWDRVLEWDSPWAKWFVGGKINVSENCLDRHMGTPRQNKAALIFEGEPGDTRTYTYAQLWREVQRFANVLKAEGLKAGDTVTLYLPMVPELAIAMLACARLGVTHSVVFGGFSAKSLADRIEDAQSRVLITADGGWRKGNIVPLKKTADEAVAAAPGVRRVIVLKRTGQAVDMKAGRDVWWHEAIAPMKADCPPEALDSEHPLFILYTSGTTGKPKGVVHTTGGYLVGVTATAKYIFDLKDEDVFWCTADIGWVTGHSYIVYGPLANGATCVMYEGAPDSPKPDRFWDMVERHGVTVFYTAPTAIRAFMRWGDDWPKGHDLSSLRLLGSVGEPINPEAWMWYRRTIGGERCPIVDTWWQTETGCILITPLPGITSTKPGSATRPFPGISAAVVDEHGRPVPPDKGGYLVITKPWPAMLRTIHRDPERYVQTYWSQVKGMYFTGDGARRDKDGYFWIMGRIDDVLNVSGHRLGTMEVESALVSHPAVAEAAVVGRPDSLTGQAVVAFVVLRQGKAKTTELPAELKKHVRTEIGPTAVPADLYLVERLPKTRSGKIMRRVLRAVSSGESIGDVTTLEDPSAVDEVRAWLAAVKQEPRKP